VLQLEIDNNYTKIVTHDQVFLNQLRKTFSYRVPNAERSTKVRTGEWDGYISFIRYGKILSGLVPLLVQELNRNNYDYQIVDLRRDPSKKSNVLSLINYEARDYQKEAIFTAVEKKRGIIATATNSGKTVIAMGITQVLGLKTLFITHRQELFKQTVIEFEKALGIKVGIIWGDQVDLSQQVTLAMVGSLDSKQEHTRKIEEDGESTKIVIPAIPGIEEFLASIEVLIIDEAHHAVAESYQEIIFATNCYYRIGLTGTAYSLKEIQTVRLLGLIGPSLIDITNDELIIRGISSKPNFEFIPVLSPIHGWNAKIRYQLGIIESKERNDHIVKECRGFIKKQLNTLIIVKYLRHGTYLKKYLLNKGFTEEQVQFISGSMTKEDKAKREKYFTLFKEGKLPILIASLIIQEGISMSSIGALIFANGHKSEISAIQCLGRGLRSNEHMRVEVRDFMDYSDDSLLEHSIDRYNAVIKAGMEQYIKIREV
jgi:superfamily II DNA or RNA helicase